MASWQNRVQEEKEEDSFCFLSNSSAVGPQYFWIVLCFSGREYVWL